MWNKINPKEENEHRLSLDIQLLNSLKPIPGKIIQLNEISDKINIESPIKKNRTVQEEWNKNPKNLVEKLSARYNPDNYSKKTDEEKLMYTIYHTISMEINSILLELNPNRHELKE